MKVSSLSYLLPVYAYLNLIFIEVPTSNNFTCLWLFFTDVRQPVPYMCFQLPSSSFYLGFLVLRQIPSVLCVVLRLSTVPMAMLSAHRVENGVAMWWPRCGSDSRNWRRNIGHTDRCSANSLALIKARGIVVPHQLCCSVLLSMLNPAGPQTSIGGIRVKTSHLLISFIKVRKRFVP